MKINRKMPAALLLGLITTACQDASLQQVAKGLGEAAQTVSILQTTVIDAGKQGLMTDAQIRPILEARVRVNQAGQQAVAITRTISQLDPAARTRLLDVLNPAISSANALVANGAVGIEDTATKQKIQLLLLTLQTTLNAVHLTIAGGA